jgi:hypothetical protein
MKDSAPIKATLILFALLLTMRINYIFPPSHKSSFFETNLSFTRPVAERFCPIPRRRRPPWSMPI